jgi:hypothetical protein
LFYADYEAGHCKKDCAEEDASPECGGILTSTAGVALFDDNAACCSGLFSWVDSDLCEAMTVGGYTGKFYVSYADSACKKDCMVDAANPECGGNPADPSYDMFLDAATCCTEKVGFADKDECVHMSETGLPLVNNGSGKWYVDWSVVKCVKDCPISDSDAECGGLAQSWEIGDGGFDAPEDCCSNKLQWMNATKCHL